MMALFVSKNVKKNKQKYNQVLNHNGKQKFGKAQVLLTMVQGSSLESDNNLTELMHH